MKYIERILLLLALLTFPLVASAQIDGPQKKTEKTEIKVDKPEVIYDDEEYKGTVIDTHNNIRTDFDFFQPPFIDPDEDEGDDEDEIPSVFSLDDEGVESEDDIILEGFDTAAIHLPKLDVGTIKEPIVIQLCDPARGEKFSWPTPWTARPTSHFGPRRRRFHYGLDLAAPKGEPIYAMFDGTVRISVWNKSYGNLVVVRHKNGLETYYAHMSARHVQPGDVVKAGDCIGLCGNTGRSYGSHLHLEIRYMGNAMNPETVIDPNTRKLLSNNLTLTRNSFRKVGNSRVRGGGGGGGTYAKGGKQFYRVRSGDTLGKIAKRNGTTINKLCQLNHINRNTKIQIGQQLRIK